ncbi:MAG: restriction endonuclease subunit S [Ignavibacteriales bacterium]|nr:restriction endonuclease subunit S [Ignavibacteriales bacterium]
MVNTITNSFDIWTTAQSRKSKGRGRSVDNQSMYGVDKLRELILELAVRGKLVTQYPNEESASILLEKIAEEKLRLTKEGKIKKEDSVQPLSMNETPYGLPKGWVWCKLGEVGITNVGLIYSPKDISEVGVPVLRSSNIQNGEIYLGDLVRVKKDPQEKVLVNKGDLLICARNGSEKLVGKCAIIKDLTEKTAFGAFMAIFRSEYNNYIKYFIESPNFRNRLKGVSTTTINQITQSNLKSTLLPLPPLAEQHRIVSKIDELMALCDQLEQEQTDSNAAHEILVNTLLSTLTNAADQAEFEEAWNRISNHFDILFTTEQSIDQLKQTILQLAVMGKLVPQNPEDEPASVLLEKIIKEKEKLVKQGEIKAQKPLPKISKNENIKGLPINWTVARLGIFTQVGTGSTPLREKMSYYFPAEVNWVTSGETREDFITATNEKISKLAIKETNVSIYPIGTLIVAMYGQGKTRGQVSELMIEAGTNQACAAIILINKDISHRRYLKLFFTKAYEELRSNAAGGAQPNLNLGKVARTIVPIPPLKEQKRIVDKVDELFSICDSLKQNIVNAQTTKIQLADTIVKQAIS